MPEESAEQPGQVMSPRRNANGGQNNAAAGSLGLDLVTTYAGTTEAEMERVFGAGGDRIRQMEALTTLRRWQFDLEVGQCISAESERARLEVSTQWLGRSLTVLSRAGKVLQRTPLLGDAGND